ncbi:MAG TPA: hypothetical protein VKU41_03015 [Polyangiaceae bacterium]|nr:hypothetical protein [Polyangiaceae bacterium]
MRSVDVGRFLLSLAIAATCGIAAFSCASSGKGSGGSGFYSMPEASTNDATAPAIDASDDVPSIFVDGGGKHCTPLTCKGKGYTCGPNADGCGNLMDCGSCPAGQYCGGGGYSVCGTTPPPPPDGGACMPQSCQQQGFDCGAAGDGCGGSLQCGTCSGQQYCGGGGFNKCGNPAYGSDGGPVMPCMPTTCQALGYNCGRAADGCGNQLQCGTCTGQDYCGGSGFDKCGNPAYGADGGPVNPCMPTTCAALGFGCGPAGDGCGNVIQCGSCTSPEICGGGGFPSVCGSGGPCTGLCTQQAPCDGGTPTTLTGRVVAGTTGAYLPSSGGPDPVPGVLVYIPNSALTAVGSGASCGGCESDVSGNPLVSATTAYDGTFTLTNVPVGSNIPVVIQLGRWRRGVTFNVTNTCASANVGDIHMPRTQAGDSGDIPGSSNIPLTAISTGSYDAIECVLLKMGVDPSEFTQDSGSGRIHIYGGGPTTGVGFGPGATAGNGTRQEASLLDTGGTYANYDQILLPCWGSPTTKTGAELSNLVSYANAGGRFFATHYSYSWLYQNNPFSTTANWDPQANTNILNAGFTGDVSFAVPPARPGTFVQWLNLVGALSNGNPGGTPPNPATVSIQQGRHDVDSVAGSSVEWIDGTDPSPPVGGNSQMLLHYTFDTPVGSQNECGHAIYSDFHVNTQNLTNGSTFPSECPSTPLTAQEKILEFMIWDLASCVRHTPPHCTPITCQQQNITCGPAGDGCGNLLDCGHCTPPQTCGGGGVQNQCGAPDAGACVPETCMQQHIGCGPAGDGCGNGIDCGPCTPPQTCGGGGVPGQCGAPDGGACVPETCMQQHIGCGPAGDGCGNGIDCGPCTPPQTCGGGGVPGQCGGMCKPFTCDELKISCGPAGDGCGGTLDCGKCLMPQTCGGGGVPGQCGGGTI